MDFIKIKTCISEAFSKYKYVGIVLIVGVLLMIIPGRSTETGETEELPVSQTEEMSVQEQLKNILSNIEGAGKVEVMLSVAQGERTIYQSDATCSQSENSKDSRMQTILITDNQRNESGLVQQKNPPVYLGAVVVAQGAENPSVKLAIVDAVGNITGLGADKISVLKMK